MMYDDLMEKHTNLHSGFEKSLREHNIKLGKSAKDEATNESGFNLKSAKDSNSPLSAKTE